MMTGWLTCTGNSKGEKTSIPERKSEEIEEGVRGMEHAKMCLERAAWRLLCHGQLPRKGVLQGVRGGDISAIDR